MDNTLIAAVSGAAGIVAKAIWDYTAGRHEELRRLALNKKVERLERQLSEFYWPIYLRLQKDNAVWERILDRTDGDDELRQAVGSEIERNVVLPNHLEIVNIIETKAHLAEADGTMMKLLQTYLRHIAVYQSMRAAGCYDKDPIYLGEPWPAGFFEAIEQRTLTLQQEYSGYLTPGR